MRLCDAEGSRRLIGQRPMPERRSAEEREAMKRAMSPVSGAAPGCLPAFQHDLAA
jgi:hypothetical protein